MDWRRTPKTEKTTHYFWAISRSYKLDDPAVSKGREETIHGAFVGQDKLMLEAVQRMMSEHVAAE
jgi:vanillate O-demethylase monooxygenase subunit